MTARDTLLHLKRSGWTFALALENGVEVVWPTKRGQDKEQARSLVTPVRLEIIALFHALEAQDTRLLDWCGFPMQGGAEWTAAEAKWQQTITPALRQRIEAAWAGYDVSALKAAVDGIVGHVTTQGEMASEMDRRATERSKLLAILSDAGSAGVLNTDLDMGELGRRYGARLLELRKDGWEVDTIKVDQRRYRFILRGRRLEGLAA